MKTATSTSWYLTTVSQAPTIIRLHWPWHTDRSLYYIPIHVHHGLASSCLGVWYPRCCWVRQSPVGRGGHLGPTDCGVLFHVLLLSAIRSTSSNPGTHFARAKEPTPTIRHSTFFLLSTCLDVTRLGFPNMALPGGLCASTGSTGNHRQDCLPPAQEKENP